MSNTFETIVFGRWFSKENFQEKVPGLLTYDHSGFDLTLEGSFKSFAAQYPVLYGKAFDGLRYMLFDCYAYTRSSYNLAGSHSKIEIIGAKLLCLDALPAKSSWNVKVYSIAALYPHVNFWARSHTKKFKRIKLEDKDIYFGEAESASYSVAEEKVSRMLAFDINFKEPVALDYAIETLRIYEQLLSVCINYRVAATKIEINKGYSLHRRFGREQADKIPKGDLFTYDYVSSEAPKHHFEPSIPLRRVTPRVCRLWEAMMKVDNKKQAINLYVRSLAKTDEALESKFQNLVRSVVGFTKDVSDLKIGRLIKKQLLKDKESALIERVMSSVSDSDLLDYLEVKLVPRDTVTLRYRLLYVYQRGMNAGISTSLTEISDIIKLRNHFNHFGPIQDYSFEDILRYNKTLLRLLRVNLIYELGIPAREARAMVLR